MSTDSPTPPLTEPHDDSQDTTGYSPSGGTSPLPSGSAAGEPTADLPQSAPAADATIDFPPTARRLTRGRQREATSPEAATGEYTPGGTPAPSPAASAAAPPVRADRYTLKQFHAKGGMGEVWLAEDCDVGRDVALKRMRRKGTPEEQERFLREARITGQLEHPGIVPVHELGSDENGQPVYVMKFVHGRTLTDVIKEYHDRAAAAGTPREVQLLRLLGVFVSLCQTVAYAHNRGVLHRDLKPDNVMLGPYGETLVLDWGLAKVVGQGEAAAGGVSAALSTSGESMESAAGTVRGTPGYMAPEMAGGEVEAIDQASDVYLLGSTLYHILTGRPPRRGKPMVELLKEATTVTPPAPRSFDPNVPRPLEAICQKAMAFAKADRYPGAAALAEDVQHYLAGEPVTAYPEGWGDRAKRWARKHQRALARGAVAVLVAGVVAGAFAVVWGALEKQAEAERRADRDREAKRLQDEAVARLAEFDKKADESRFYLASLNPATEQTPQYDPRKAVNTGREALTAADRLADPALPLTDRQRADVKDQQYDLLLLLAQARSSEGSDGAAREALDWLARAESLRPPGAGLHRLRAECYVLLGDGRADDERRAAEAGTDSPAAIDYFLRGEQERAAAL
ncbi:MAG TPA: serine/threonine-protein kinase, partial [Gemmataceae bacterium]|nr:serine/threonine-protein kinase [Gemmataceae bacterium]